jgi:hypothetical protein
MAAMGTDPNPLDDPADAAALGRYADELLAAIAAALPGWVERSVLERYQAWAGGDAPIDVVARARLAGALALAEVMPRVRVLLAADVEAQRTNPLAILREAVRYPSEVLAAAGVPALARDAEAERLFPDDAYDLGPAAFGDLHPSVHDAGLGWGAAKAHVILARRRRSS